MKTKKVDIVIKGCKLKETKDTLEIIIPNLTSGEFLITFGELDLKGG